uniref:Uncharacterized protein n=1 Tax=Romanomermis culicivorax TaxID=13658 RepID=A0A915HZ76_ROMCU
MAKSDNGEDVQKALGKVPGIVENAFTDAMDKLGIGVDDDHKRRAPKKGAVVVVYKKKKRGRGSSDSSSEKEIKSKSEKGSFRN